MLWEGWRHYLKTLWQFHKSSEEHGQGLVEYAMLMVLVVLVAFVVVTAIGPWVGNVYSNVINGL